MNRWDFVTRGTSSKAGMVYVNMIDVCNDGVSMDYFAASVHLALRRKGQESWAAGYDSWRA